MTHLRPSARAWVDVVVIAALAATAALHQGLPTQHSDWVGLALLLACAAVAHVFPIRAAFDNVTYHLTSAFMVAGAMLLSPLQVAILATVSLAPDLWLRRRVPGVQVMWAFNSAQTTLAALAALAWLQWTQTRQLETAQDAVNLVAAVAIFTLLQAVLVGIVVAFNAEKSLMQAGTFSRAALLSDFSIGLGGLLLGGLWIVKPMLLLSAPALLVVLHRATRNTHLAEIAERDPKTGLHNARFLERALEEALQRTSRPGHTLAVLFADLDRFKRVNDRYGHDTGDLVLRGVAQILDAHIRRGGVVARYGGEEFVMLLPVGAEQEATDFAEQVREAVESHRFALPNGGDLSCTISIGLALSPADGTEAQALLARADAALREAKTLRNCVVRAARPSDAHAATLEPRRTAATASPSPVRAAIVWWTTVGAGAVAAGWSLFNTAQRPDVWLELMPFVAAGIVAEFLAVDVYEAKQQRITLSFSMAATMATVAAQPLAAPLVGLVAAGVGTLVVLRQRARDKFLFNLANPVLSSFVAGFAYALLRPATAEISVWSLAAALLAVMVYVGVNLGLLALMISVHSGRRLRSVLVDSSWFAPTKVLLGLTGAFVGGAYIQLGPIVVAMFITPVLLMRYTLAFYARRSQETIHTLEQQARTLEQQTDQLEHLATHDSLTDLPNRLGLERQLHEVLSDAASGDTSLLLFDLNRFKEINDTFGHRHGDLVLQEIGARLQTVLRTDDTLARLGGDEFAIALPRTAAHEAEQLAAELRRTLAQPVIIDGHPVDVNGSVAIATTSQDECDAPTLLRRADVAMDVAKRAQVGYALYRPEYDQHSPQRLSLVGELRQAIDNDALTLVFQPQVACGSGLVAAAEALVRWNHPERGPISPDEFIPLAERTSLIRPLTRWVVDRALQQCRAWLDSGSLIPVAVNASMHDVQDVNLPDQIAQALEKWQVPAEYLRVEVTEGTLMADARQTLEVLGRLRALGVEVAVDDFGTGYSSLGYLSRLPVTELKIDRSFVSNMHSDAANAAIVRSTISLGHDLGLRVVAEGVEDEATWRMLQRFGCDSVQGYWLSRPVPPTTFVEWLATSPWGGSAERRQLHAA